MMHRYPKILPEPNYFGISKCYLTTIKRDDKLKLEIVIDMTPIQIITT